MPGGLKDLVCFELNQVFCFVDYHSFHCQLVTLLAITSEGPLSHHRVVGEDPLQETVLSFHLSKDTLLFLCVGL